MLCIFVNIARKSLSKLGENLGPFMNIQSPTKD